MRHLPLALKYRPKCFKEIVDQDYIKKILESQVKNGLTYPAFIFAGPRGIGKTTTARVFARSLNCLEGPSVEPCGQCPVCLEVIEGKSIDVVEIDGASNRGIDQVRQLREQVKYVPLQGRYKVYIIDEVHMLTNEAFNALLKTLEEPPPHVIFILATTAPTKVPQTVLSRCQRFDFHRIGIAPIVKRIEEIIAKEKINVDSEAIKTIARYADGSMRDALVILEQLTGYTSNKIKTEDVLDVLGAIPHIATEKIFKAVLNRKSKEAMEIISNLLESGNEPFEVYKAIIEYLRLLLFISSGIPMDANKGAESLAHQFNPLDLLRMLQISLGYEDLLRKSGSPRIVIEVLIIRFINLESTVRIEDLLKYYEKNNTGGDIVQSVVADVEKVDGELAGYLKKAKIYCEKDRLIVCTQDPDVRNHIIRKKNKIESVLKNITGSALKLEIAKTSLKERVLNVFDAEEIK